MKSKEAIYRDIEERCTNVKVVKTGTLSSCVLIIKSDEFIRETSSSERFILDDVITFVITTDEITFSMYKSRYLAQRKIPRVIAKAFAIDQELCHSFGDHFKIIDKQTIFNFIMMYT